ncbi:hypothetical protein DPEC_G00031640 [Dallia pectoralis]|uniref:Uncharacterized protein n=1 Tax=Dallia pectoralis TaxID=75939 RepID=A0ACC2HD60_DALPE|nr:hypothetical protein DPEC_G00031640 [Dallia pectoralis]
MAQTDAKHEKLFREFQKQLMQLNEQQLCIVADVLSLPQKAPTGSNKVELLDNFMSFMKSQQLKEPEDEIVRQLHILEDLITQLLEDTNINTTSMEQNLSQQESTDNEFPDSPTYRGLEQVGEDVTVPDDSNPGTTDVISVMGDDITAVAIKDLFQRLGLWDSYPKKIQMKDILLIKNLPESQELTETDLWFHKLPRQVQFLQEVSNAIILLLPDRPLKSEELKVAQQLQNSQFL